MPSAYVDADRLDRKFVPGPVPSRQTIKSQEDRCMKVGVSFFCQNYFRAQKPDHELYREDLKLADMVEPLGFDSIWGVEHHFSPYTMIPDVVQFLTYMAGRTSRVGFGSMVVVLPWHDPVR